MHTQVDIGSLFAARGLRCTRQRRALYEALLTKPCHPTADQLYRDISGKMPGISLATVYNTLEAFCGAGLAQKIAGVNGCARYDATVDNHLHARDQSTGEVFDVPQAIGDRLLEHLPHDLLAQFESHLGFEIDRVQIELVGRKR